MAKIILEKYIRVKSIEADIDKRTTNCSIVNIIKGKYLKTLISINKGKKYNNNIFKNRGNKIKRLTL